LPLFPGVVGNNSGLHIRGSRSYATYYLLEGFSATNPLYGSNAVPLIPQAVQSVDVHTGTFGVRLPSATGGIVESRLRTGGDSPEVTAEYRTDDLVQPGKEFLGTTPQGLKSFVVTVGGPVVNGIRYFLAGRYAFLRNDQSMFLDPFRFEGLTDDGFVGGGVTGGRLLLAPDAVESGVIGLKRNYIYKNWTRRSAFNATVAADFDELVGIPLTLRVFGVFGRTRFPGGGPYPGSGGNWPQALDGHYRSEEREMMNESTAAWASGIASIRLGPSSVFDLGVSYQRHSTESYDPNFGRYDFSDYLQYQDSLAHTSIGFPTREWRDRYTGPFLQSTIYGFELLHPESPNNAYSKRFLDDQKLRVRKYQKPANLSRPRSGRRFFGRSALRQPL
jgi:hypothetical protein